MIVAGAQVHRAALYAVHLALKQRYLAVHLQVGQAVEHTAARALQLFAPEQVVKLVKPGVRLKKHHDLFAVFRRLCQRGHNGAVAAYAVKRLLDGAHGGILRRTLHQMHHGIKRMIGVIHQPVAPVDLLKHIVAHQLGDGQRLHVFILELRPLDHAVKAHEHFIQIQRAGDTVTPVLIHPEKLHEQGKHFLAHALLGLQAHNIAGVALGQHFAHGGQHIGTGFLHHGKILVAKHPEHRRVLHLLAGEEAVGVMLDDVLHADQVLHLLIRRKVKQARQRCGQRHHLELGGLAAAPHQLYAQVELLLLHAVGNQILHLKVGADFALKQHLFAFAHHIIQRKGGEQAHAFEVQLAAHALVQGILAVALAQDGLVYPAVELFARYATQALCLIFASRVDAAVAHLKKLIHIGGDNRQKLGALQKRIGGIIRLVHNTSVKAKPAKLPVLHCLALDLAHVRSHVITPFLWCAFHSVGTDVCAPQGRVHQNRLYHRIPGS